MQPPNPPLLLCDADVVFQLFIGRSTLPLKCLRDRFGVQPTVVPEVDAELLSRPRSDLASRYRTASDSGLIQVLGVPTIRRIKSQLSGAIAEESPDAIWQRLQDLRDDYYRYVDIGESSTYAAALTLQMPTTSNDGNAIRTLLNNDVEVPVPVLRMFDLVAFAVQSGEMSVDAADDLRSRLLAAKEHVPKAFLNAGFADGLEAFRPRLVDGSSRCSVRVANDVVVLTPR